MNATRRSPLIRYAIAADLVLMAAGVALLFPDATLVPFLAFFAAVALTAWLSGDEAGLAATAISVIVLSIFFTEHVDPATLTGFAATGAAVSLFARAARHVQEIDRKLIPELAPTTKTVLPFALGLPLLVVVLYADISDLVMRHYPVPSLLRPLILLLALVVLRHYKVFRPASAALHTATVCFAIYALVVFATSIWARDGYSVDTRFSEITKALMICVVTASLAASWKALYRGFVALIATATVMAAVSVLQVMTGRFQNVLLGLVRLKEGNIYGSVSLPRASGPPVNDPNFYARILLFAIPIAVVLALTEKRPWRRIAYAGAAAIVTAATLLTYSRGAMLALGATALILIISTGIQRRHILAIAIAGIAMLIVLPREVTARLLTVRSIAGADTSGKLDSSVEKRRLLLRAGLHMFDDHPFAGVGAGNFNTHYLRYASRIGMSGTDYGERGEHEFPHGLYIEIGSETGVLGLIAFAGIVLAILGSLWNARHAFLVRDDTRHAIVASGVAAAIAGYLIASVFLHESAIRYFGLYVGFGIAIARLARVEPAAPAGVRNTFLSQLDWSSLGTRVIRVLQYNERKDGTIALVSLNDREVFAKQHGPDGRAPGEIARYEADLLQTLRAQLPPPYSVPEVLLVDEQHGAIVLARAPGTPLDALLRNARTRFAAGDLVHAVQRAGRWLGLMQKITRTNEDGHARLETLLEQAMDDLASLPSLGGRRPDIANYLHGLHNEVKLQLLPVVGQHGDYWPGNIFIDGERVEVIDFEGFRPGLPLEDVTYFLTYLDLMPLMRRHLPALATSFIEGWNGDTRALELFRLLHALRALVRSESGPPSLFQLYTNYRLRKFILGSLQ